MLEERGVDDPGHHMRDPHAGAAQLIAQRVREGADRRLGGGVHGLVAHRHTPRQRPDQHHPPRPGLHHARHHQPHQSQRGPHIDVQHLVEGVRGHVAELTRPADPGTGHQQIHRAHRGQREVGELPVGTGHGEIRGERRGRGVLGHRAQPFPVPSAEHQPPAALVAEPAGHGRADAGGRAGDERGARARARSADGLPPRPGVARVGRDDLRSWGGPGAGERVGHEDHLGSGRTPEPGRPSCRAPACGRTGGLGVSPSGRPKRSGMCGLERFGRATGAPCLLAAPPRPSGPPRAARRAPDVCWWSARAWAPGTTRSPPNWSAGPGSAVTTPGSSTSSPCCRTAWAPRSGTSTEGRCATSPGRTPVSTACSCARAPDAAPAALRWPGSPGAAWSSWRDVRVRTWSSRSSTSAPSSPATSGRAGCCPCPVSSSSSTSRSTGSGSTRATTGSCA